MGQGELWWDKEGCGGTAVSCWLPPASCQPRGAHPQCEQDSPGPASSAVCLPLSVSTHEKQLICLRSEECWGGREPHLEWVLGWAGVQTAPSAEASTQS